MHNCIDSCGHHNTIWSDICRNCYAYMVSPNMYLYDNMAYTQCVSSCVALLVLDKFKSKWLNWYDHWHNLFSGILKNEHNKKTVQIEYLPAI